MNKILTLFIFISLSVSCKKNGSEGSGEQTHPIDVDKPIEVSDIKPKEGGLGTGIIINGNNFGSDTSKIEVYFNDKKALLLKVRPNVIYAMVPKQPGDLSEIKVVTKNVSKPASGILEGIKFQYHIKASVTTVAGVFDVSAVKDGPALEANFKRPSFIAVSDDNNIVVSDDDAGRVAALSLQDNKVYTLSTDFNYPWQSAYSSDQSAIFITERRASTRPLLFKALYRNKNWLEPAPFYDQRNNIGNYTIGSEDITGLTADDEYVYLITSKAQKLVRVHQQTRKVELIGEKLNLAGWNYLAYNKKDGYIYIASEEWGRIYRFDPRHTPADKQTPWISNAELQHLVGTGAGAVKEGAGTSVQMGTLSGITCDGDGNVYTCDFRNHVIWKVTPDLVANVIAGQPAVKGYKDGKPSESLFNSPYGIYSTTDGILYVADTFNRLIRCIAIQ